MGCRRGEEDSRLGRKAAIRGANLGLRPAPPCPSVCAESTPAWSSSPSWAQRPTQESTGASPCSSCVHWGRASPDQRIHRHEKGNSLHSCSTARPGQGGTSSSAKFKVERNTASHQIELQDWGSWLEGRQTQGTGRIRHKGGGSLPRAPRCPCGQNPYVCRIQIKLHCFLQLRYTGWF